MRSEALAIFTSLACSMQAATGATTFEHLEGYLSDAPVDGYPPEVDGLLGVRAVASKRVEFDFERGRLGIR